MAKPRSYGSNMKNVQTVANKLLDLPCAAPEIVEDFITARVLSSRVTEVGISVSQKSSKLPVVSLFEKIIVTIDGIKGSVHNISLTEWSSPGKYEFNSSFRIQDLLIKDFAIRLLEENFGTTVKTYGIKKNTLLENGPYSLTSGLIDKMRRHPGYGDRMNECVYNQHQLWQSQYASMKREQENESVEHYLLQDMEAFFRKWEMANAEMMQRVSKQVADQNTIRSIINL